MFKKLKCAAVGIFILSVSSWPQLGLANGFGYFEIVNYMTGITDCERIKLKFPDTTLTARFCESLSVVVAS